MGDPKAVGMYVRYLLNDAEHSLTWQFAYGLDLLETPCHVDFKFCIAQSLFTSRANPHHLQ